MATPFLLICIHTICIFIHITSYLGQRLYVKGGHTRTDWFIQHLYQPKGFFTPPYETEQSLRTRLSGLYREAEVTIDRKEISDKYPPAEPGDIFFALHPKRQAGA